MAKEYTWRLVLGQHFPDRDQLNQYTVTMVAQLPLYDIASCPVQVCTFILILVEPQ